MKPGFVNTIRNLNRSPCNGRKRRKAAEEIQRFKSRHRSLWRQFWDSEGVLLIDYAKGTTMNGQYYANLLAQARGSRTEATGKLSRGVLFYKTLHLSGAAVSREGPEGHGLLEIDHPPYSPDLAATISFSNLKRSYVVVDLLMTIK
ncbi:hypothetical protein EVAR_18093_1 [Eumeta japonica]|uniref:Mariner Mos1 transposase n=1 Tax=Eumeta variegata TaxID=151549 RepID=A0A4C1VK08_EUMVA|nr:hypothetical protein EVAR_18093_1 [Eumeta japonica]